MRALLVVVAALALLAAASPASSTPSTPSRASTPSTDAGTAAAADPDLLPKTREAPPPCPPAQPMPLCAYLTLKKPSKAAAEKLAKKLRTDGVEPDVSDELVVSASLDDAQLSKLLGAKVRYALTAASASDRTICDAQVASFKPPARYSELASLRLDAQCP